MTISASSFVLLFLLLFAAIDLLITSVWPWNSRWKERSRQQRLHHLRIGVTCRRSQRTLKVCWRSESMPNNNWVIFLCLDKLHARWWSCEVLTFDCDFWSVHTSFSSWSLKLSKHYSKKRSRACREFGQHFEVGVSQLSIVNQSADQTRFIQSAHLRYHHAMPFNTAGLTRT